MEEGPPKTLEEAVESVRMYQRVQVEAYHNHAKRSRANVEKWVLVFILVCLGHHLGYGRRM